MAIPSSDVLFYGGIAAMAVAAIAAIMACLLLRKKKKKLKAKLEAEYGSRYAMN